MSRKSLIKKFDKQAKTYDKYRNRDAFYKYRTKIFPEARGSVLEVGVGAGLNFSLYDENIELTAVDFSPEMLQKAESASKDYSFQSAFLLADVEELSFDANSFDTIISSLTLCSYEHPVQMLNHFRKWCKPYGKILMLEHGISSNKPISWVQKAINPLSLKVAGCHQSRNIRELIQLSDLTCIKEERYIADCLYLIWAKP